jgi:aryl-alcohol dehydrogenase-like predicted oxidoreductase
LITRHSISALVLAWWTTKPSPAYPLIGCCTMAQLKDCFQSLEEDQATVDQRAMLD